MSTTQSFHPSPTELQTKGVVKASKGWVSSIRVTNSNAGVRYFHLYDSAVCPTASVVAVGTLTNDGTVPATTGTVQIGSTIYTYMSNLTEVNSYSTLTSDGTAPATGTKITIGPITYTYRTALTVPHVAYEVLIGSTASAAASLDNLKSAINLTDATGTTYSSNTKIHPTVTATTNANTTQLVQTKVPSLAGDSIATSSTDAHSTWTSTTLAGYVAPVANEVLIGASVAISLDNLQFAINACGGTGNYGGAGIEFSTGTVAHPDVIATTNGATTQVIQACQPGVAGNNIATLATATHVTWGATQLASGAGCNTLIRSYPITPITGALPGVLQLDRGYFDDSIRFDQGIAWAISTTDRIFTDSATASEHSVELNWRQLYTIGILGRKNRASACASITERPL